MHNFFAGMMGMFMGITSLFHGGGGLPHTQANVQANLSGTPGASASGMMRRGMRLPNGERPFFGMVTNVNGSTLTVQMQGRMMFRPKPSGTPSSPSATPSIGQPRTVTVTLDSATTYTGGAQADIKVNTKVAGVGKTANDGSLTAVSVQINPT